MEERYSAGRSLTARLRVDRGRTISVQVAGQTDHANEPFELQRRARVSRLLSIRVRQRGGAVMGADVYISGPGFWYDRSAIEDEVEEWLGNRGEGTGGGGWEGGSGNGNRLGAGGGTAGCADELVCL